MAREVRTHRFNDSVERAPMVRRHLSKQDFGTKLDKLLAERDWSQSDLSRYAGIPRDSISRYVRALTLPEPKNLTKLAEAFKMDPNDLLPNYSLVENELAQDSPLEIKAVASDPTFAWIRINRMVKMSAIPAILAALEAAENA